MASLMLFINTKNHCKISRKIVNYQTVNSLKRPKVKMPEEALLQHSISRFIQTNSCFHLVIKLLILTLTLSTYLRATNCDVVCPRDTSPIYPCSCNNGTQGMLIKCSKSNLATLSNSLRNLREAVEHIEIESSTVSRLFGPLFNDSSQYKFHSTLRELDIRASGVKSIDQATFSAELRQNLQYLMLDRNNLTSVPIELISSLTNLKLLNLSSNSIGFIDSNTFAKVNNLTELDLSNNRISRLAKNAFNSLYTLEYLNLNGNEISKLDKNLFAFGRKLKFLDLSNNKLLNLDRQDFNELTNLETLKVANNQLTTLPRSIFSRNAKLYNLDLSFNKLEDIDTYLFKSVRFLRDLNISGNLIKEITKNTFSPTTRIKRIDVSQNLIQALAPETFKNLEWLERVNVSHNQIVNISNDAFNHIYSVEIDLSFNKLTRIFYYAFHEVSNITKLDLSHNLIDDGISLIAFEQTDCAELDLSYNQIQDISKIPISNLTGIRYLDISHNQITEFNKKSFTQKFPLYELHTIDASYNNISQVSGNVLERLKSVRFLNMSHNSLRRLTSGGLGNSPTLLELDLSYNNLVEVVSGTLVGLVSMKNLDMSYNRLKKMIPIPVALNSIHLEYNEISQLSRSAFPSLNSLLELYLDHNRIAHIEEGTFATLLALNTLTLSYNNLSSVPAAALRDLASLQMLRLDGNNIQRLGRRAFGTLPIVFDLFLDHNNITSVADHAFDGMLQLLTLNLSHNGIAELPAEAFAGLVSLRSLDLSNNQLTRFENKTRSAMEDLLSLEVALMNNNKLSTITPRTFLSSPYIPYKLNRLDLSNNLIGIIANNFANGLKRVEWLNLRNNIINEILPNILGNVTHLRHLDLSHNKLRAIKDGTFAGPLVNLSTILLNNNKLTNVQPKEFDHLRSLTVLDLSANRLELFAPDYTKWVKRGLALDLRQNSLECTCDLVPFIAWIDSVQAKNHSYATSPSSAQHQKLQGVSISSKLVAQYLHSTQIISNINCAKPEALSGKSIMQILDVASSSEMSCDKSHLEDADAFKRLETPVQLNGAEPYYQDDQQSVRIGWNLNDPQLDILNFVVVKTKFPRSFDLNAYRLALKSRTPTSDHQLPTELDLNLVPYNRRTLLLRDLDSAAFYVICISYETSNHSPSNMIDQSKTPEQQVNLSMTFANFITDYSKVNCVDLDTLLHLDSSEKLVSGSTSLGSPTFCLYLTTIYLMYLLERQHLMF